MSRNVIFLVALLTCANIAEVRAQYDNEKDATIPLENFYIKRRGSGVLRLLLSKVHIGFSTGYGSTRFVHKLDGFGILQKPDSLPKIFLNNQVSSSYSNWFNNVQAAPTTITPGTFLVQSDTAELGFKSKAFNIPLKATLHVELYDRYRIGGGFSIDYMNIGNFAPTAYGDNISGFAPEKSTVWLKKYFLMLGGTVYRYYEYSLVVDANIGAYSLGGGFNKGLISKGVLINLGVAAEREMSEYFRLFVRPSYELKSYKIAIPEGGPSITHRFNAFYVNVGFIYRLPELRKCPIKDCHGQMNHSHGNRDYRSRVHPIYKKQNPHYGENYPKLIKYKGRNKKKLNPY